MSHTIVGVGGRSRNGKADRTCRSYVGFNERGDFKIDCDDEQWSQIVKVDPHAHRMRSKSWPHWDKWKAINGKDQTGGGRAEDMIDARMKLNSSTFNTPQAPHPNDYNVSLEDLYTQEQIHESLNHETNQDTGANSYTHSVRSPRSVKKLSRKQKPEDTLDVILEVMTKMHKYTNQRLEKMSTRIGYDFDLSV
ncbi:hypothetical protein AAHA92_18314 [Salvia divinorum]|uniref:Uncharacterized protein n=1 Tax=Salvia divinorum TaxID=28513 RepID=A0ABD1H4I2_SALDI